jgi:hypothetical protein
VDFCPVLDVLGIDCATALTVMEIGSENMLVDLKEFEEVKSTDTLIVS